MWLPILLMALIQIVRSQSQIDNEVIGEPQVRCDDTSIVVNVRTKNTFKGNIFVRGYFADASCRVECATNDYAGATIAVSLVGCGVSRVRQIQPPGMNYLTTVEIAFHPLVITRRDKAYQIRCFYAHTDQEVKNGLTVSALPTQSVEQATIIRPQCVYSIRLGSLDGPIATSASVGDMTFHRWECDNPNYGMLVKNCCVNSGTNSPVTIQVIDDRGCPITSSLLQAPLKYAPTGTLVWAEIDAYKFPDQMKVVFTCDIAVCAKVDNQCVGITPPDCSKARPMPFSTANSGGPFRFKSRAEAQTPEPTKVTAKVVREPQLPRFQNSFPKYEMGRFPTSPPIDGNDGDIFPTVRAVAEGDSRQGLERFNDAGSAPWPLTSGVALNDDQFNDDDQSETIDIGLSSTTLFPSTTDGVLSAGEFRDALLAVVDKYNETSATGTSTKQMMKSSPSTTTRMLSPSTSAFTTSSTTRAPTTMAIPALPTTPAPPFNPRDFFIPQALESERERLGLSERGMEQILPPLIRLIRTAPSLETTPLIRKLQQDKAFDEVLQVTAEMLVSPVETMLNGSVPEPLPPMSSSPIISSTCIDRSKMILLIGIFSFLAITSMIALFYAIAQCYFARRNRLWLEDRLSIDQSSSYSPRPTANSYQMPYGTRRLGYY